MRRIREYIIIDHIGVYLMIYTYKCSHLLYILGIYTIHIRIRLAALALVYIYLQYTYIYNTHMSPPVYETLI